MTIGARWGALPLESTSYVAPYRMGNTTPLSGVAGFSPSCCGSVGCYEKNIVFKDFCFHLLLGLC